ncbi:alkane 1-monooxygenase [Saccharospirillum salsuginis]|uniref:Alkane 1-monooxygenase n=1 Tax=Saccharospirillum salsuginis TaxID=418750 RepID=A0A918K2N3_9GAMM|nr:alkane 1-monooxygenase [Saccharospirillum salsuginis]GGX43877.1 alkane 1-monooxygenase [Saccharospirillum salsuginis]
MSTQHLDSRTPEWHDDKRWLWLLGPGIPLLVLTALSVFWLSGQGAALVWIGPVLVYLVIPLLDIGCGEDRQNPPESVIASLEQDRYYRVLVAAYLPSQFAITVLGCALVASQSLPLWHLIGLVLTVGTINGIGINSAHELGHKKTRWERGLARLAFVPVAYGHFFIEHNQGHHVRVATPEDPASARMGESFWRFLPRTLLGSVRSAWRIERLRLERAGSGAFSWGNRVLQSLLLTTLFFGGLTALFGWSVLPFLLLQALYGISLLEVINYIEHYGLLRERGANGQYERCQPRHSWNSNHRVTNLVLYHLQRHSDHHANPTRRYQSLRHFDESPQLPSGYASLLIPAYLPFWWFRLMDKRVHRHYDGDIRRANLQPGRTRTLLRRWPPPTKVPGQAT